MDRRGNVHTPRPSALVMVNSICVLVCTAAVIGLCIAGILNPATPFVLLGAVFAMPQGVFFGVLLFISIFRRSEGVSFGVAVLYFLAAGLAAFGMVTNVGEALLDDAPGKWMFLLVFSVVGLSITVYAVFCGVLHLRWYRRLRTYRQSIS